MLMRAKIGKPGIPKPLAGADFISDGNYQTGAVLMGPGASIAGPASFPAPYVQGVISFWANYDSSASALGDTAKIIDVFANSSFNDTTLVPPTPIGCVGIFLTSSSVDLYLRDGFTGITLLKASGPAPATGWHHYICSWDASRLVGPTPIVPPTIQLLSPAPTGTISVDNSHPPNGKLLCTPGQSNGNYAGGTLSGVPATVEIDFNTVTHPSPYSITRSASGNVVSFSATDGNGASIGSGTYDISGMQWTIASQPGAVYTPGTDGNDLPVFFPNPGNTFDVTLIHLVPGSGSQIIEAQWAMDRGGGPVVGGPVMDTAAQDLSNPLLQPMANQNSENSVTGVLIAEPRDRQTDSEAWVIKSPVDASCKWAYMYFGIPRNGFFDLSASRSQGGTNLDYFITSGLNPQNLGYQGHNVTPIAAQWMHTGAADNLTTANVPYFQINNAASPFNIDGSFNSSSVWVNTGFPLVSTIGPPLPPI